MMETILDNMSLNSGWELKGGHRRTFEYTGSNITTINFEKLVDGNWIKVFRQDLTYDGMDNVLTVTGVKL